MLFQDALCFNYFLGEGWNFSLAIELTNRRVVFSLACGHFLTKPPFQ